MLDDACSQGREDSERRNTAQKPTESGARRGVVVLQCKDVSMRRDADHCALGAGLLTFRL